MDKIKKILNYFKGDFNYRNTLTLMNKIGSTPSKKQLMELETLVKKFRKNKPVEHSKIRTVLQLIKGLNNDTTDSNVAIEEVGSEEPPKENEESTDVSDSGDVSDGDVGSDINQEEKSSSENESEGTGEISGDGNSEDTSMEVQETEEVGDVVITNDSLVVDEPKKSVIVEEEVENKDVIVSSSDSDPIEDMENDEAKVEEKPKRKYTKRKKTNKK